jgi:methyl-accepting chemotaxis protein
MQRWRSARSQAGQATFSLVIVVVVVAIAVVLLYRTAWTADSINDKAGTIANTADGINTATAAVLKLGTTNELAASILNTAEPLEGQLNEVVRLAQSIDGLATSINGTAGTINGTAKGINGSVATILGSARSINDGVAQINTNLNTTLALAAQIKSDTANILLQADNANNFASCLDRGLLSSTANTACVP